LFYSSLNTPFSLIINHPSFNYFSILNKKREKANKKDKNKKEN